MLQTYLQKLGFSDKETVIYLVLAEIGVQPASVIARRSGLDRVTAYKNLKKLAERGFVKVYFHDSVQSFGIENFETIKVYLKERASEVDDLLEHFPTAANILHSLKEGEDLVPKLQIFEGDAGIRGLFRDILSQLREEGISQIRVLSSNTFEEWLSDESLQKVVREFFKDLQDRSVQVEAFEVTGGLVPERLRRISSKEFDPEQLPVTHGTTSIFLVGHTVYLACYKSTKIALKIQQANLSQIFHFLFDMLGKGSV